MIPIPAYILIGSAILLICIFGFLILLNSSKTRQLDEYQEMLTKLKHSFNDLDEQAKLIVRTDLELNKAQEELDKRLNGLEALQKTSRLISTTLDEHELFHRLKQSLMSSIQFEKSLILLYDPSQKLQPRIILGVSDEALHFALANLERDVNLTNALREGHTFSSANSPKQRKEAIVRIFNSEHFVISPILTQHGIIGIIFMGNQSNAAAVTEGDEELVSILANQIGQSLENARLFEEIYRSSKALETKIQERTRELQEALKEVQNISKTKSDFISAVSHELRTPLTSIKGYAAILMEGKLGDIPQAVKDRLAKINIHSDNLVKLINDLLDISRIESGKVEMALGKCRLSKIIENVYDLMMPQLKNKNIQWKLDMDPVLPEMMLDVSQVERVFINLIGNAVKFTPEKGAIGIKAHQNQSTVNLEVWDTGIGIPEEDQARLFDEFYRVDNEINQNVKGTGLGLSLAKKIVEAHDGKMWLTSMVGKGTSFHFTLPVKTEADLKNEKMKDLHS